MLLQGEFIERLMDLDKIVTRQDILDFVSETPDSKMRSLIELVDMECGWLFRVKASKIKEVQDYRDKQIERVSYLIACIKERTECAPRMFPDFLTERGIKAFNDAIEYGLIDMRSYAWLKSKASLSNWVADINSVDGVVAKLGIGKSNSWVKFEKYFEVKGLASKNRKSDFNNTCPDYDPVRAKIFPEIYKK